VTILLNYHIGHFVLGSMCVGVSVRLGWSDIRVAGFSLQHEYDDGYINARNMLST